jgi:thiol-disulfide isomerase/thioredoxin
MTRCLLATVVLACALLAACGRAPVPTAAPGTPPAGAPNAPGTAMAPESPLPRSETKAYPTLALTDVDGKPFTLAAERGHWVVLNFWATWCAPCLKEMPELSALDAMREDVRVMGLAFEDITPADMRAFLKTHPVVYPIAIADVYNPPADFAPPRGLPTTYLIGPAGKVVEHFLGPTTAADIEARIAAAKAHAGATGSPKASTGH